MLLKNDLLMTYFNSAEVNNMVSALRLQNRKREIQYLQLTQEIQCNDLSWGRWTTLAKSSVGYLLDEEEIAILPGASWEKKKKMLDEMMSAYDNKQVYALVGGYPCSLHVNEYRLLTKPPLLCIGELI